MSIKNKFGKLNPLDAAINGLDKAVEFMDKAEEVAVKISEKKELRKKARDEKSGSERLYPDDRGNAFLYIDVSNERVDTRQSINGMTYSLLYRFTFYGEDGKLVYHAKTKSTKKQNIVLYDMKDHMVGQIVESAFMKQTYFDILRMDGEVGAITYAKTGNGYEYKYDSLVITHSNRAKDNLTIRDKSNHLIANMLKHRMKKCLVFHSGEDDVLMALLLLSVYSFPISKERIDNGGRFCISTKGSRG